MSCFCPLGYTPTIDYDDCINTLTAATSGGTYFYTATTGSQSGSFCNLGTIFYEDITNLSFPITNSGTTTSAFTQNGTLLFNTEFLVDNSGRVLNIQAGGQGGGYSGCFGGISPYYGPPNLQNSLWGSGSTTSGRLNVAGIFATTNPNPINEWIGFSYCLDIPIKGTYFIGFAADDLTRIKINGDLIYETSTINYCNSIPQTLNTNTWTILPFAFNSGLNIVEMEGLNLGSSAAFAAEIYSGSVATLSAYTTTIQLTADTLFSTLDFIGQDIPLTSSITGGTSNTGYTCPSGYTLYTCSGTPYCIQIDRVGLIKFCISDTGLGYDDNFSLSGTYNSEPYWTGDTSGRFIYLTSSGYWCLSDSLGGTCLLEGAYPCPSTCPDLCDSYFNEGICPTPTPTPTVNCSVLDFNAIFDCEVTPTPSITPTNTPTPTVTPTPSISEPCGGRAVNVTITGYTPTPTPTPSITPSSTPQITRPCSVSGNVVFNTVLGLIECPSSKKFIDCENGNLYYASNALPLPSGGTLSQLSVFKANVDGISRCITYVGIDLTINGMNIIELVDGPLDFDADCSVCVPNVTQTPTPTPTPSITPTITPTPTASALVGYYLFQRCNTNSYVIQTLPGPTSVINQVFSLTDYPYSNECWKYISYSSSYPSLPLGSTSSFLSGNSFQSLGVFYYSDCSECIAIVGDSGEL